MRQVPTTLESTAAVKRLFYLCMTPIIMFACILVLMRQQELDKFNQILQVTIILTSFLSFLVLAFCKTLSRRMELFSLVVFSIFHLHGVFHVLQCLHQGKTYMYLYWSPLFLVFTFVALEVKSAFVYSLSAMCITLIITLPMYGFSGDIPLFWLSQLSYLICLTLAQKIIRGFLEKELWKRYALTDPLTKLPNRRAMKTTLEEVMDQQVSASVIFFDVDHFKQINDSYGHDIGDLVLKELSKVVKSALKSDMAFGRWGGEEFLIVLPQYGLEQAIEIAEQIRVKVANHQFQQAGHLTVSLGVSTTLPCEERRTVIWRADKALYEAKLHGRNRVKGQS